MREISKKIVLLGNESVGKTSLVKQYVHSIFSDEYLTTIGIKISKKQIELAEHRVKLMIWDVAGDLLDQSLYDAYLKGAHGFILVFDLTKPDTYHNIIREMETLKTHFPDVFILIVGNKSDLVGNQPDFVVNCDILTSAKTGNNVDEAFTQLAQNITIG